MDPDRETPRIRPARKVDLAVLVRFNVEMARETEGLELDPALLRRGVAAVLEAPELGAYRVADLGGRAVGALMVTQEWSDWRDGCFWWIQSVYVEPPSRGLGIYRALHESVLAEAELRPSVCGVRLYVERNNDAAQRVYERLGMHATGYLVYEQELRGGARSPRHADGWRGSDAAAPDLPGSPPTREPRSR